MMNPIFLLPLLFRLTLASESEWVNPKLPPHALALGESNRSSNVIHLNYHMGPVLSSSPINVYIIWYGLWAQPKQQIIKDFILSISPSPYTAVQNPSVSDWWNTVTLYTDQTDANVSRTVLIAGEYSDHLYSQGGNLTRLSIQSVIANAVESTTLPIDHKNGIYMILTSEDVSVQDYCRAVCGFHFFTFTSILGYTLPYAWVGNSCTQCPGFCAYPFANPAYGPKFAPLKPPNDDVGIDGMISAIGHELAELATNPLLNAWYAGEEAGGETEIGDLCLGLYGSGAGGGYLGRVLMDGQGRTFNMYGLNGRKFLLQWIWSPLLNSCTGPNAVSSLASQSLQQRGK